MQGKPRSKKSDDLPYIFFKIRTTRCPKTRRSWQRRARLALAKHDDLTPSEQHEICSVWSKSNVDRIDSPAMSKLFKQEHCPQPHQTISARSCTRRRFDAPIVDGNASRINHVSDSAPQHQANYTPHNALLPPLTILFQGYIYQRFPRGSAEPDFLHGNRENRRRRRGHKPVKCKKQQKRRSKTRIF